MEQAPNLLAIRILEILVYTDVSNINHKHTQSINIAVETIDAA